ncbi:MAG TPA: hypothetical protein PKI61_00515 [bacterium]|nr:hypothetical protein [bacterium]HPT29374.1 hypothetical protein [bacterium]
MKIITKTLKWVLAILFLYNIGIIPFVIHQSEHPRRVGTDEERRRDIQFLSGILDRAYELGDGYTPSLYFQDLARIEMRKRHDSIHYMINELDWSGHLNRIIMERREKLARTDPEKSDKFWSEISAAQKEYDAVMDPGKEKRLAKQKQEWNDGTTIKNILHWLWSFYLKNFLLAFALLYLWWVDEKKKWRLSNPLSFIICLLIYPYTILRVWIKKLGSEGREWAMEISFRRTQKTIFTLISEDELATIKRFANEKNLKGYKEYLRNRGLVVRHSFLPTALVTMVLLTMIPKVYGSVPAFKEHDSPKYFLEIKAPPGPERTPLIDIQNLNSAEGILLIIYFPVEWAKEKYLTTKAFKTHRGFAKTLDPIPLFN